MEVFGVYQVIWPWWLCHNLVNYPLSFHGGIKYFLESSNSFICIINFTTMNYYNIFLSYAVTNNIDIIWEIVSLELPIYHLLKAPAQVKPSVGFLDSKGFNTFWDVRTISYILLKEFMKFYSEIGFRPLSKKLLKRMWRFYKPHKN